MTRPGGELFELCKEVYERTGWGNDTELRADNNLDWYGDPEHLKRWLCPKYTSDYLLGRLPSSIDSKEDKGKRAYLTTRKDEADPDDLSHGYTYFAWYVVVGDDLSDFGVYADTPLKALLKLTLKLHEEGLL